MKKFLSVLTLTLLVIVSSCSHRTCPTYTKAPVDQVNSPNEASV